MGRPFLSPFDSLIPARSASPSYFLVKISAVVGPALLKAGLKRVLGTSLSCWTTCLQTLIMSFCRTCEELQVGLEMCLPVLETLRVSNQELWFVQYNWHRALGDRHIDSEQRAHGFQSTPDGVAG